MSELVELRYTGERAVSFLDHGIGHVGPQGTFRVPADEAERYLRRGDIEDATPKPGRKPKEPDPEGAEGAGPSDDASALQDGETNGASPAGDCEASGSPTGKAGTGEQ